MQTIAVQSSQMLQYRALNCIFKTESKNLHERNECEKVGVKKWEEIFRSGKLQGVCKKSTL